MAWRNLVLGFLIAAALSCGAHAESRSLAVDGRTRSFIVYRPAGLNPARPAPLVVVLHGGFGSGAQAEHAYHWDEEADRHGFVVAYPDGIRRSWNAGGDCCGPARRGQVDDVRFLTELIAAVSRSDNIDRRRVYLAGISNGAAMSYRYACEGGFPVAAVGAVSGSLSMRCPAPHAVSVMEIHGLEDRTIPFAGGHGQKAASSIDWLGVEQTLDSFRAGCGGVETRQDGKVRTTGWNCPAGREVVLIAIADAGHQWPGATPEHGLFARLLRLDPPSTALDATDVLWNFFARHSAD